jgi:hypothetical protein
MTVLDKVLRQTYREQEQVELRTALYAVLKTMVVLVAPVNRRCLSVLAETSVDSVNKALLSLHSILAIPDDIRAPIRLHHASFRDFIVDPRRCSDVRFSVDSKCQHKALAERCLRLMAEHLRQDICEMRAPGIHVSQIDVRTIERQLSQSLEYACCFWAHHVKQANELFHDLRDISDFLYMHLLHWLEALSLLGRAPEAVHVLSALELLMVSANVGCC